MTPKKHVTHNGFLTKMLQSLEISPFIVGDDLRIGQEHVFRTFPICCYYGRYVLRKSTTLFSILALMSSESAAFWKALPVTFS